jgi:predicted outer membrane protein
MKSLSFVMIAALAGPALADPTAPDQQKPTTGDKDKDKPATAKGKLNDAELQTLAHVHQVNQFEIDMGKLAQKQGSAGVQKYGAVLVRDHTNADRDFTALAKKKGVTIPTEVTGNDADQQEMKDNMSAMDRLKTMKGKDFDKEFLPMMVAGHDKEIVRIDAAIAQATDNDLQASLKQFKPMLQRHADMARDLEKANAQASK